MSTAADEAPKRRFRRKKKSGAPGRLAQMRQVYQLTREVDPSVTWWMLGVLVIVVAASVLIGVLTGHPLYATLVSLPMAALGCMLVLSRKADRAMYKRLEGQPGAAGAALSLLRRGWITEEEPVAIDPRTHDAVFRIIGRPGVVLVGDGPPHRLAKMLAGEEKKHRRYISNTPITLIQVGTGQGQLPVSKLARHVNRMKPTLTKDEVSKVYARVRSMPGLRAPIPAGLDPSRARPDRKAVRGR